MNRRMRLFFLVTVVSALLALPAAAFTKLDTCNGHWTRWQNSNRTLNVSTHSAQFSTAAWQSSVAAARNGWVFNSPGNNFQIFLNWTSNNLSGLSGDGNDDVVISPSGLWNYPGFAAITKHKTSDCDTWNPFDVAHYTEVDVLLNPGEANGWDKSTQPVPADYMTNSTQILLHEFGHVLGLGHEDSVVAVMNSGYPTAIGGPVGNNNEVQPLGDDARGARAAYGTASTVRDVAGSAVRLTSPGVSRTIPAPGSSFRGASVSFQFTILNRGTTDETIPVHFYLSPTRYVHPSSSFYLGSTSVSLLYGRSTTGTATLVIPSNAPTGNQYIGWYTDPYNGITPESSEGNNGVSLVNATYISPNRVPIACFNATPSSGSTPLNVSLNATCTSDADGDALTYFWEFPDGSTSSGQTTSHTFYSAGNHTIVLTVTDPSGASSSTFRTVSTTCTRFCPEDPY